MWMETVKRVFSWEIMMYTALIVLIPLTIYKINAAIHKYGDPPWKDKEN